MRAAIAAERRELAAMLSGLPAATWDAPSLCDGWRVREVVTHMTMPFRYSVPRFVWEMVRDRGRFNRMADRCARRDAVRPAAEIVAALRDNAEHPWKPPRAGFQGALSHDVIHGLDITVALGLGREVPRDRLDTVLRGAAVASNRDFFGVDLDGVELRADDVDWSHGSGTPLCGSAQDLLLVLCGRRLPAGRLRGEPAERFSRAA